MNSHGTGKIKLGWTSAPKGLAKKLGNVSPLSVTGATGDYLPDPPLSWLHFQPTFQFLEATGDLPDD
jgi:hypothetical protein